MDIHSKKDTKKSKNYSSILNVFRDINTGNRLNIKMKNQVALLLLILVLGTVTSPDVQQGEYDHGQNRNGRRVKPCSLLKKLLNKVRSLSDEISVNILKERADYKSKTALQRGLQKQLRSDLKIQDKLIKHLNKNDVRISKHRGKILALRQNLKENEKNLNNVDKSIRQLNKELSYLIHQKNHLLKEFNRSRGIRGSLKNENIINRKQLRQLQRDIKQLIKQIKKLKIKRAFLHIQLIKCSYVVRQARKIYRKKNKGNYGHN